MSDVKLVAEVDLLSLSDCLLGELLRELTFVGEGTGCYETFEVRGDAKAMTEHQVWEFLLNYDAGCAVEDQGWITPRGFEFSLGEISVVVAWWWDGDGTLVFRVRDADGDGVERVVANTDCKKDYTWEDVSKVGDRGR